MSREEALQAELVEARAYADLLRITLRALAKAAEAHARDRDPVLLAMIDVARRVLAGEVQP